ncbi:MAG: TolC family protein, partial [Nitrosomonadales bacterium]|nr:TolC family protein [Nitrosomonadales bacterium]
MRALGLTTAIIGTLVSGCAYQSYSAKPLEVTAIASEFRQRDPLSQDFQSYLKSQGYDEQQLPIQHWGLNELTYSALYFHSDLDVARAMWRSTQAGESIAGLRPNPGISGGIERHSDTENGISPWTFLLAIDIPIETGGKRQARMDSASSLSEASRIEVAQAAWKVRSRVHASWIAYQAALSQTQLLEEELSLRTEIVEMLEARLRAGMVSSLETANARLLLQKNQQQLDTEKAKLAEHESKLANHAGLSLTGLNKITLASADKALLKTQREHFISDSEAFDKLQEAALLNRLDVRAALARYDATEAKLRLEIARQYPDIVLSPGYSYDQGDKIWSIGISTLLSL